MDAPDTWGTFAEASAAYRNGNGYHGIGRVLTPADQLVALDHAGNPHGPADGDAGGVAGEHGGGAFAAERQVEAALDDAEEVLGRGVGVRGYAAVEPADGAVHGFFYSGVVGGGGGDYVVQLHYDV